MNINMRNSALEKVAEEKVKHEVNLIIKTVSTKLQEYVEDGSESYLLGEIENSLQQVEKTLQLLQINGAVVLAREICEVVEGLIEGSIHQQDKAQECLSRGILQMSDYLEYVQAGNKDLPVVLLPLLNDLRGVRDAPLFSEHILFFPDLDDIEVPNVNIKLGISAQEYAKSIRYAFQTGLVSIIQNENIYLAAAKMCKVAIRLHQCSAENSSRRLWWVTSAIAQALAIDGLSTSTGLASLLGQVDRQIKRFIELDETNFAIEIPSSLIKNLLYYVGIAGERGRIVSKVKQAYGLNELIPNELNINKVREGMSGPNADVLEAVSKALHEDIETVKDSIELYLHSKNNSQESVSKVVEDLQKIADTLSMIGLDEAREVVLKEVTALNGLSSEELEHVDNHFIAIAENLIKAENLVDNFIDYRVLNKPAIRVVDAGDGDFSSPGDEGLVRKIQVQTIKEALVELEEAKNAISQVLTLPEDEESYVKVQDHFRKVHGALSILDLDDAAKLLKCIQVYLLDDSAKKELGSQSDKLDAFADSITSVECYLEALIVDESDPKDILEYGAKNAAKLMGNDIQLSNNSEPLQTIEIEEFAADNEDSLALQNLEDPELKKKIEITESYKLNKDVSEESPDKQADLGEIDTEIESLSATSLDIPINYDLIDSQDETNKNPHVQITEPVEGGAKENIASPDIAGAEAYVISINTDGIEQKLFANRGNSDPEVLEIFIEEAEEELGKINLNRTLWKDDEKNEDALNIIRRSFHTLKGGGRLIGAEIIGEYAWQLEAILNKVIDKSLVVTIDLHNLIENASLLLNDLVFQLKTGQEPVADVVNLYAAAQSFLQNKKNIGRAEVEDLDTDANKIEVVSVASKKSEEIERQVINDCSSKNDLAKDELDEELYKLFLDEARQHIGTIEKIIESKKEHKVLPIDNKLLYALHTLFGCSRTAQVDAVSKLIGPLDKHCQECEKRNQKLKIEQFDVFVACIEHVKQGINKNADALKYAEVNNELLQKINNLQFVEILDSKDVIVNVQNDIHVELEPTPELKKPPENELGENQKPTLSDTNIKTDNIYQHIDVYEGKDTDLVDIFLEEASDILETCNQCLEKWRVNHEDANAVSEFRRQIHTLKGSARMATYINIGDFSHTFETFVIDIVESRIEASDVIFNVAQRCLDHMNAMVDLAVAREDVLPAASLIAELEAIQAGEDYSREVLPESKFVKPEPQEIKTELEVKPDQELDVLHKNDEGEKKAKKKTVKIPVLRKSFNSSTKPVISGQESVRLQSNMLDNLVNNAGEVNIFQARLEQVGNNYNVNIYELEQVVDRLRDQLRNLEIETETQILSRHAKEVPEQDDFDPLELDRYSNIQQLSRSLAESVNDLLIIKDILSDHMRESELLLSQQRRISGDLQAGLMRTRMVQFNQLVPRLQRIVRQTSRELKKDTDLKFIGQHTEVDSSILNRIVAPLEHLVRNAVSHGIEEAEQRKKVNKPMLGEIKIDVTREGAEIVIIVSDDGAGLDVERIKNKAQELGLTENHELSEREALNLILTPGFSTAGQVSQVSGRGVGMDVVVSELKQLGGSLQIDSVFGQGAQFVIRIPITLAITQSLLIKCGNSIYAVPLSNVEGVVRLSAQELKQKQAENTASYHYADRDYRLCHLGSLLEVCQPQLSGADKMFPVLLVRSGDSRMAIHVEAILGNREIVVKPLAPQLSRLPAVSGATILGDGNVVLILDIQGLIRIDSVCQAEGTAPSADENVSDTQSTVMVVDDSITIRKVTTRFLERNNYNVVTAKDGVDAVQKLQDFTPALILLDIEMPRMDGYELATHVRNNKRLRNVPIIMITSRTGDKHRQRAMDIGVQEYLGKPYNENELLSYVQSVVETKQCH